MADELVSSARVARRDITRAALRVLVKTAASAYLLCAGSYQFHITQQVCEPAVRSHLHSLASRCRPVG